MGKYALSTSDKINLDIRVHTSPRVRQHSTTLTARGRACFCKGNRNAITAASAAEKVHGKLKVSGENGMGAEKFSPPSSCPLLRRITYLFGNLRRTTARFDFSQIPDSMG